eukprot:2189091-Pyramimonas_sp.AAC.1
MSQRDAQLLATAGEIQQQCQMPMMMGGDFNLTPTTLLQSDFVVRTTVRIHSTAKPTHVAKTSRSILDHFLVSEALDDRVVETSILEYLLTPHRVVQLELKSG